MYPRIPSELVVVPNGSVEHTLGATVLMYIFVIKSVVIKKQRIHAHVYTRRRAHAHTKVTNVSKEFGKHESNQRGSCSTSADYQGTWSNWKSSH